MTAAPSIILVDGTGYLFRAFHALPPLATSSGMPTGAIYGLIRMLQRLTQDYPDSKHIIVFDAPGPTFRDELFSEYKANRPPTPEDLRVQIKPAYELVRAKGLPLLTIVGVEADDVMGTLAQEATDNHEDVLICTADKDMAQLVNDHVSLLDATNKNQKILDRAGIKEKFGVRPEQIIDYLALVGDAVDNIPGVPKVGPKTAVKWLEQYDDLETILAHREEIKGKVGESLREVADQLPLSKTLATINCSVELPQKLADIATGKPDIEELKNWYTKLEFRDLLAEIDIPQATVNQELRHPVITEPAKLKEQVAKLRAGQLCSCYIATTELDYTQAELIGFALAGESEDICYIPVGHNRLDMPSQLPLAEVLPALQLLFADESLTLIGQDLKFSLNVLHRHGINCKNKLQDNMLASYVLKGDSVRHDFPDLIRAYLGRTLESPAITKGKGKCTLAEVPFEQAAYYATERADLTLQLHRLIMTHLAEASDLNLVLTTIEGPLMLVLAKMEQHGALVDAATLKAQSLTLKRRLNDLEMSAWKEAGEKFNLSSPKQLGVVLYEKLGLPVLRKTPKGAPSTAEPVLAELALHYDLPKIITEHRSLAKLKTTYTDKLPEEVNHKTGRIHTSFHQAATSTGRLSSTGPNLQNIPIRTEDGRLIRKAFIAPPGKKLVAADYSQIELRIMAHISEDTGLLTAFRDNQDIHRATAAEILGIPLDEVTDNQRRDAKAVNFGLIYGMSAFGLSRQLNIQTPEAQNYINLYFQRYPRVKDYMDQVVEQAKAKGYVETLLHRRVYLPNIKATNGQLRQAAERAAINAPMQGTAADIIKLAMIQTDHWLQTLPSTTASMILQVHDELLFEVDENQVDEITEELQTHMSNVVDLKVPLVINVGVGDNWLEAH